MPSPIYDFTVIGAGIAGASIAAELSQHASVLMLERESQPGYHSTGRSAAMFIPSYGPVPIQALTKASADFFNAPPEIFGDKPLLNPRSELLIAREDQLQALDSFCDESGGSNTINKISAKEVIELCPLVKRDYPAAGVVDRSGSDIDVHALHQGFLAQFTARQGELKVNANVQGIDQIQGDWQIKTPAGTYKTKAIVNAAGAWADEIGKLAGAERIGLTPKRRTAMTIDVPLIPGFDSIPLTADIEETFYIKPDAGRLLISPANENPVSACDVQPEELDIALCIHRIETAFDIKVDSINSKWAGLRSFVDDHAPVIGYSATATNFFWLAGQGGYGIQSSPALSRLSAALALGEDPPEDILKFQLNTNSILVDRLNHA